MADWTFTADDGNFEAAVIEESQRRPVVADFWAAWCAPCRMLGPVLEKVVDDFAGKVALAKIDVDRSPTLARRYSIRGIPAVKVFVEGGVADEFTGALPESGIRRFLGPHVPSPATEHLEEAQALLSQDSLDAAAQALEKALQADPSSQEAALLTAELELKRGGLEAGLQALKRVDPFGPLGTRRSSIENKIKIQMDAGGARAVGSDPLSSAKSHASRGDFETALQLSLRAVEIGSAKSREEARTLMLRIFEIVGPRSPVAQTYRDRLSRLLH